MKQTRSLRTIAALVTIASLAVVASAAPASAAARLKADYRFEKNLASSAGTVAKLERVGTGDEFLRRRIDGVGDGVWKWPEGSGLLLGDARPAVGPGPGTYTFVMLVRLDAVDGYRKLIHFGPIDDDQGFYVHDHDLYPYDLAESSAVVKADRWYQIALTRDASNMIRAFVDGKRVLRVADPTGTQVLGPDNFLRFLIDDEGTTTEESGGMIARLRIYNDALTPKQIAHLSH